LGANHKAFSIGDRANILHDSYLLAYQGSLGYSTTASISSYLSMSETDYIPWRVFLYHSTLIAKLLEHRSGFLLFAVNKNKNDFFKNFFSLPFRITQIVLLKDYLQIGF
jgi:hypothetical protein